MKENFSSFYILGVFKNSLSYVYVNLILGSLSSEFHSTSSTSESPQKTENLGKNEQKTKIMETVKLEGEREI